MPNTQSRRSQVNTSSVGLVTALATVWGAGIQIAMADDPCTDPPSYAPIVIRNDYCSGKNSYFGRQYSDSQIWICNHSPLTVAPPGVTPTVYYQLGGICTQLANNGGWVRLDQVDDQTLYFNGSSAVLYAVLYDGTDPPANDPIPNPSCGAADYAYAMFEATTTLGSNGILTVNWDLSNADQFSFPHHGTVLDSNRQEIQSAGFRGNLSASGVLGQVKTYYSAFQYYPSLQCPTDPLLAIGMADLVDPSWYSLSTNYQLPASLTSCDYTPRQGSPNCDDGASDLLPEN